MSCLHLSLLEKLFTFFLQPLSRHVFTIASLSRARFLDPGGIDASGGLDGGSTRASMGVSVESNSVSAVPSSASANGSSMVSASANA